MTFRDFPHSFVFVRRTATVVVRSAKLWALCAALGSVLCACPNSGPDIAPERREAAREISLGAAIVDDLDVDRDPNDWVYFTIPSPGAVVIEVRFDNPEANGTVDLTGEQGNLMGSLRQEPDKPIEKISITLEPGRYYLHVRLQENRSDYTLQASFNSLE